MRNRACEGWAPDVLEGTRPAFDNRESKYYA